MSQESATNNVLPVEQVKVKKPRAPTLPAKDKKILQAIFWYLSNQRSEPDEELERDQLDSFKIFASVEEQKEFVAGFYENAKEIEKQIRKIQTQEKRNIAKEERKAAKAAAKAAAGDEPKKKRQRKPKAVSADSQAEDSDAPTATDTAAADPQQKVKKPRAKNTKIVTNTQDTLINELVSLARSSSAPEVPPLQLESILETPQEPAKKVKPTKKEKPTKPVEHAKPTKEEKPVKKEKPAKKEKPTKEEKPAKLPEPILQTQPHADTEADPDDDDDELDVEPFTFNGTQFLKDADNNLYSTLPPHDILGTFLPASNSIQLI
jgi:hypothetical protein